MLQYSQNNIIIITTDVVTLEFWPPRFAHPGAWQLIIISFFNMS